MFAPEIRLKAFFVICIGRVACVATALIIVASASARALLEGQAASKPAERSANSSRPADRPRLDVIYVPTPQVVVDAMLRLATVTKDDVVYDLGCGDGRVVVTAAREYGCKAVGIDIDPRRVAESLANVKHDNVSDLVQIRRADIFATDLRDASVVTLYLLPHLNMRLLPQLERLKPGSRIVAHSFNIKGVKANKVVKVPIEGKGERTIYLYVTPLEKEPAPVAPKKRDSARSPAAGSS